MKAFPFARFPTLVSLVVLLAASSAVSGANASPPFKGKKLLYVGVAPSKGNNKTDENVQNRLRSLGFVVTIADEADSRSNADCQDLVVVSASSSARLVAGKYKDMRCPVLVSEARILDDMSMTGKSEGVDFGDERQDHAFWLVNAPHPLQGGLPNGLLNVTKAKAKIFSWGKPGLAAIVIATIAGMPEKAVIFGYEKGAIMDGDFPAPARRVMFFLDGETFDDLTESGLRLFDASVTWAMGSS
jgi:hypothetical protein